MNTLKYELLGLEKYKTVPDIPVIITLHGMGSNYLDLRPLVPIFGKSVIELHVQGGISFQTGFTFYIPDFKESSEATVVGMAAENIYAQIKQILIENDLQKHPLGIIGFSQGAILASTLATLHPNWLQAAVILSGRLPDFIEINAKKELKPNEIKTTFFISQGLQDPIFAPQVGQHLATFFENYALSTEFHQYQLGHGVSAEVMQDAAIWANKLHFSKQ
ncbi:dienelactone hydrolase family protein [Ligilactobacillus sp. WILCCON 0076]|uniref:Dienelactone hydrolase family protein n=1 Tax=Ligilactobacillus ubinensis TaxID=2876789 RepID=A0A9X2FJX0_9LACO|nr:alpha/beta fold hydrolase [Ligilactobacillus ubinensis]MCP0886116.1 dienelactone hydrolase family protein [Ligilactobacillus ubinensis]